MLIYFFLPESPAWYVSQNKLKQALKVLKSIARTNRSRQHASEITYALVKSFQEKEKSLMNETDETIDYISVKHNHDMHHHHHNCVTGKGVIRSRSGEEKLVDGYTTPLPASNTDDDLATTTTATTECKTTSSDSEEMSAWRILGDLFRPRKNCIKTLLLGYIWAALMLLYYGISLGVMTVELVDPYLMYFLSSLVEFAGNLVCYLNDVFGRKKMLIGFFLTPTVIYAIIVFITITTNSNMDQEDASVFASIVMMCLALIGKCAVSGAYNISYIYTAELHPTYTRNTALLFLNCLGSVSSLIAPQINMLKNLVARPAPYIVYSSTALLACMCVWVLPETKVD